MSNASFPCPPLNRLYCNFFLACLLSYATEIVIDHCHGKRNCTLVADSKTFTNPCKEKSRVYLKVVYACGKFSLTLKKLKTPN